MRWFLQFSSHLNGEEKEKRAKLIGPIKNG